MLCNFDLICRLCTNQTSDLKSISDVVLTKQVLQCTSVEIMKGDGLPDTVCQACLTRLSNAYEFRLQCQQSDAQLRQQLRYEALGNSEIPDDMQIFQCQQSESDTQVKQQMKCIDKDEVGLFDIVYTDLVDHNLDLEYAQMVIVEGSDVTTIKRVKQADCDFQTKSEDLTACPDTDITEDIPVAESSSSVENEILSYPTNRVKRKKKRVDLKPVQLNLTTDSETEETEHNVGQDVGFKKKYPRKPKQCHICGKVCKWLPPHMLTHTGVRRYVCEYCTKSFKQLSHYKGHINIHTGNKPYACPICGERFHAHSLKRSHIVVAHTKGRNFKCHICEKTFRHGRSLSAHKKIHTHDRKHLCSICNKAFLHKSDLTKHFRIHTGEKHYKCDTCDKTFSTSRNLQTHRRTHKSESPQM